MNSESSQPLVPSVRSSFRWAATALALLPALHLAPLDFDRAAVALFVPFILLGLRRDAAPSPVAAERVDRVCLGALAVAATLGMAFSTHWAASAALLATWIWTLAIPLVLHRFRPSEAETRVTLLGVAAGGLVGILLVIAKTAYGADTMFPVYGNARLMGLHLLCGSLAVMALLVLRAGNRTERAVLLGLALILWTALFWTGGRAPMLGLAAGAAACLWANAPVSRGRRACLLFLLAASALAASLAVPPLGAAAGAQGAWERSTTSSLASISSGRLDFWAVAFRDALESPWWGRGADAYNFLRPRQDGNQPHNFLLQWFQDFGAVGAVALVLLIARAWRRGLYCAKGEAEHAFTARAGWAGLCGLLVTGLLDGVFYHAIVLLPLAFFLGAIPASVKGAEPRSATAGAARPLAWILGPAALLICLHQFLFISLLSPTPPSPNDPAPWLLRRFPSTTNALWRWLDVWQTRDPALALDWADWASRHSNAPAIYHAFAGKMAITRGDLQSAESAYAQAVATTHHTARAHYTRVLDLVRKAREEQAAASAGSSR